MIDGRYAFAPSRDPLKEAGATAFHAAEQARSADLVKEGSAAVRTTYSDGGQNAIFAALLKKGANLGTVSRPEALAYAGLDVTLVPARPNHRPAPPLRLTVDVADWKPDPAPLRATLVKVHPAPIPAVLDIVAMGGVPLGYALARAPTTAMLITGAMPMRPAALAD